MDSSPTSLFDSYSQDFEQIISSIRDKLEGEAGKNESGGTFYILPTILFHKYRMHAIQICTEQRKASLRRVEMELDEADEMVRPIPCPPISYELTTRLWYVGIPNGDRNSRNPTVPKTHLYLPS